MSFAGDVDRQLVEAGVAPHIATRLGRYGALLERWGRVHNLVRFSGAAELAHRHLLDALAGAGALEEPRGLLVDVGSGAGLPGVPLLVARPGWRGLLVEPRQKRWAFLRTVIRELGLEAEAVRRRYQDLELEVPPVVVTARAVGRHRELLEWARTRLAPGGRVLLWVGLEDLAGLRSVPGWRVVSSPLPTLEKGFLATLRPCFT